MKISTVIGARPQFIKAAVVSRAIRQLNQMGDQDSCRYNPSSPDIVEEIVHTGQHYDDDMSGVFFSQLGLPVPAFNLEVGSGTHGKQTALMMERLEELYLADRPDIVLNYGDTNSTLASAIVASKLHIPIAHVESGLRSFNRQMPEEINRVVTDHVATWLFCPTETAVVNLRNEGVVNNVILSGDVMYDCAKVFGGISDESSTIISRLNLQPKSYLLATVHRSENTDIPQRLAGIFRGLLAVATENVPVVLPLHPRTSKYLKQFGLLDNLTRNSAVRLIDPVNFLDMVALEKNANLILTDSGGVQKEAFFHEVPCVTLRNETEWVELIECGWNVLAGADEKLIMAKAQEMLARFAHAPPVHPDHLYGDGNSAINIVKSLL